MTQQHVQDQVYRASMADTEKFWSRQAENVFWHKKPSKAFQKSTKHLSKSKVTHDHWSWYADGEISTTYNCVDRHVKSGNGDCLAICWDSPVTQQREQYTYKQLLGEVETLAGVLREEGVKKGDVVLIYMPMIPAALFAMLAIARLGAIHAVVFGGFSPAALAQRMEASQPRAIMTASCGIEGSKKPTGYKSMIEEAIAKSSHKPEKTIIWQREQLRWDPVTKEDGQRNWQRLIKSARNRGLKADAIPVRSGDGLYIIYTSGTTGLPKGVVRSAGGHAVGLNFSMKYLFGVHGPGDVQFTASDIGWVVGHSYIVYAPLLVGATTILFEGKPVGTPDASTLWRIIDEYKVTTMFTAPTALRAVRREDPENDHLRKRGEQGSLRSLRALFLAGERSEPSIVEMYSKLLSKYCAPGALVVDNWWSSESGSPISGIALSSAAGLDFQSQDRPKPLPIKPGAAGKAMPGFDVRIVDDDGKEVPRGVMGNIVMGIPLAPTAFTTLWNDEERFYKGYMKRFDGQWVDTGDAGIIDNDGYISIMSRADDVINVAAHRFSTGAIEQAITTHPSIAEAAVVGIPDQLKGSLPFAFVTLSTHDHPEGAVPDEAFVKVVQKLVREQIGAIASLGGIIQGKAMIPKTRSGKTLRRVLRDLLENATHGEFDKEVSVPSTIEDQEAVNVAREKVREYFDVKGKDLHKATESRAKLKVAGLAKKALQDTERINQRFWYRYERARQRRWSDSDDEDGDEKAESQKSNQFEEEEEEPGFDWDARGSQLDAEEYRLKAEVTKAYYALLSDWDKHYKKHHTQPLLQLHTSMKFKLPIEIRNMVYHHLCKNPNTWSVVIGQPQHNPNFQSFSLESAIGAEWYYAQEALDASTRDVHKPAGWMLNPEYVGRDMAREAAEVFYSINEFRVSHESLSEFLTVDRTQTDFKPYEYVRGTLEVHITTTCGNGDNERAWSTTEHETAFLNEIYTNLNTLTLLTRKQQLHIKIRLYTGAPLHATRYNGERRFYNIMEAIRSPIYDLIHGGVKVEVEHMKASSHSRRSFTEGEANHFHMGKSAWEAEKEIEGRGPEWLPTENYISREMLDEIDEGELTRRLVKR